MRSIDPSAPAQKLDVIALANSIAVVDTVLHLLFHLWGWWAPQSYENSMAEFALGFPVKIQHGFGTSFFVFWAIEVAFFWLLGATIALLYNTFSRYRT
jgi:hypothetical protein